SLSREFGAFVAGLDYEKLPPEIVDRAKGVTLQALSSALLGSRMPASRQALALMQEEEAGGGGAATVLGHGATLTKAGAAFVNAAGIGRAVGLLREGRAVRNALLAVALAKHGTPGGETTLEGEAGFYHSYAGNNQGLLRYSFTGRTRTEIAKITEGLGRDWMF